jgi:hypothetical protein
MASVGGLSTIGSPSDPQTLSSACDDLMKLGYLAENEIDDKRAIGEALSLFVSDQCAGRTTS